MALSKEYMNKALEDLKNMSSKELERILLKVGSKKVRSKKINSLKSEISIESESDNEKCK